MKVLITGSAGQLGRCLQDRIDIHGFEAVTFTSSELDITDLDAVIDAVTHHKPECIINAAAYTAVDTAESDKERAFAVNALGTENLAKAASINDIPLIHVSTDYVFDGKAIEPYKPNAVTAPQSIYGSSKLAGEKAVQDIITKFIIIRTAWVFSEYGNNFVKTMLRLGREREELGIVADQKGCPTYAGDLANAILTIVSEIQKGSSNWGIYHYCGDIETTWYDFANAIFNIGFKQNLLSKIPLVNRISTEGFPTPAKRPSYSVMDNKKIIEHWNVQECDWKNSLTKVIHKLSSVDIS
jgi:dTDP-4-dehydrorhamnose reductase